MLCVRACSHKTDLNIVVFILQNSRTKRLHFAFVFLVIKFTVLQIEYEIAYMGQRIRRLKVHKHYC